MFIYIEYNLKTYYIVANSELITTDVKLYFYITVTTETNVSY